MRATVSALAFVLCASVAGAQREQPWKPELRPFVGTSIPTGQLRDFIGSETVFGLSAAGELRPWLHVLGTFGYAPAKTRYVVANQDLSVFQYDIGAEVNSSQPFWFGTQMHPFWGAGLGGRTYAYKSNTLADRSCVSGYGSTGIEFQAGRTAARIEARDNVFCYRSPLAGVKSATRNDVNFSFGLAYHFR